MARRIHLVCVLAGFFGAVRCGGGPEPEPQWGFCEENQEPCPERPAVEEPATLPWLHVDGAQIVDAQGATVALRGFNFGSWLMMESWIPAIGLLDEGDLLRAAEQIAAELGVADLLRAARDSNALEWLVEARSHRVLVEEWREHMFENAEAGQLGAVEQFWAWFDSQPWVFEEQSLWDWLWRRFGYGGSQELRAAFQDHYITEIDVERLAALGLNHFRLPVWFELLESDFAGGARFQPEGWQRLHRALLWARRHRLYVILDLHGAPGGQSASWHQGLRDGGHLFENEACQRKTARLWQALASYFKDDPHLAAYDLLNEPMSSPGADGYRKVHDAIYRAVRAEDGRHMVMMEDGYQPASLLPSPAEMGWENAVFSIHLYPGGSSAAEYLERIDRALLDSPAADARFRLPLYLGEFNAADGEDSLSWAADGMDLALERLNRRGVHWGIWTWKYYTAQSLWGLYHPAQDAGRRIDVRDASFEKIRTDFIAQDSANFAADPRLEQMLRSRAADPVRPLDLESQP